MKKILQIISDELFESSSPITIDEDEEQSLKKIIRAGKTQRRVADRARIILWSSQGVKPIEIAKRLSVSPRVVICWINRFKDRRRDGLPDLLNDLPRTGRPSIKGQIQDENY